jgi:hypothetical protein
MQFKMRTPREDLAAEIEGDALSEARNMMADGWPRNAIDDYLVGALAGAQAVRAGFWAPWPNNLAEPGSEDL